MNKRINAAINHFNGVLKCLSDAVDITGSLRNPESAGTKAAVSPQQARACGAMFTLFVRVMQDGGRPEQVKAWRTGRR